MVKNVSEMTYAPVTPDNAKNIVIIGAGGIVSGTHLPAYKIADYPVKAIYDIDFEFIEGVDRHPVGYGFSVVDHLTHNVYRGRMDYWAKFYEKLFNFQEIRYFDIKGDTQD